jgi:hypothetical protein
MQIRRGVLRAFNSGTHTATVQVAGSVATWLGGVAVARNIPSGDMVAGRNVALLQFDPANPDDMVVCAVWT